MSIMLISIIFSLFFIPNSEFSSEKKSYSENFELLTNKKTQSLLKSEGGFTNIVQVFETNQHEYLYGELVFDQSLFDYLGISQIQRNLYDGITGSISATSRVKVVVLDNLIDFDHPHLKRCIINPDDTIDWVPAVEKVVLINNVVPDVDNPAYEEVNPAGKNPYDYPEKFLNDRFTLQDYIFAGTSYAHGTGVAGVINQIAPGAEIISLAMPKITTTTQLYYSIMNALKWLYEKGSDIKIVNNSNRWGLVNNELSQGERDNIELKIEQLLKTGTVSGNKLFFTSSAGNSEAGEDNDWNIIYPSHLANNWEDYFYASEDAVINGKYDYCYSSAIATGFTSVSAVYDTGS